MRSGLDFERLYEAFGGKLAHWQDYITDYGVFYPTTTRGAALTDRPRPVNVGGKLDSGSTVSN